MFGIVWVYNKVMNTPSMIVGPSTILLQPHVGGFHASDWKKKQFSADFDNDNAILIIPIRYGHPFIVCKDT